MELTKKILESSKKISESQKKILESQKKYSESQKKISEQRKQSEGLLKVIFWYFFIKKTFIISEQVCQGSNKELKKIA